MFGFKRKRCGGIYSLVAVLSVAAMSAPAQAEMVLSKVIVDLSPERPPYDDIEALNDGPDRMYVLAEAAEIVNPGTPKERRVSIQDPATSGLLVAPQRLVLEPGQRRVIRISAVTPRRDSDRIYRVTIKPVSGPVSAEQSALKVFVGYDALVIFRPARIVGAIAARREGRRFILTNESNTALEVFDGKQCDGSGGDCRRLATARIYAGANLEQELPFDTTVEYNISNGRTTTLVHY